MTCLEKYLKDHPGKLPADAVGRTCPHLCGIRVERYPKCGKDGGNCAECWNREIRELTVEEKRQALITFCVGNDCPSCPYLKNSFCTEYLMVSAPEHIIHAWYDHFFGTETPDAENTPTPADGETVNHPGHYNREGAMECLDEMVLIFGVEQTKVFCLLNAWKYRYRAADKNGIEDLKKSDWYIREYAKLAHQTDFTRNKVQSCEDPSTVYVDLGDIRLILHEGTYVGWFRC